MVLVVMTSVSFRYPHSLSISVMTVPYLKAWANYPLLLTCQLITVSSYAHAQTYYLTSTKASFNPKELLQGWHATHSFCLSNLFLLVNISPKTFRSSTISIQPKMVIYACLHFLRKAIANTHKRKNY